MNFNNSVKRPFDGPAYLVGKATSGTDYIHRNMNEDDILLHLVMARFVTTLSKKQRLEFCYILELMNKKTRGTIKKKDTIQKKICSEVYYFDSDN